MIKAVLQGAIVMGGLSFAFYGLYFGLKKIGVIGAMQKSFRPKPTQEIYDDVKKILGKGNFKDFSERISKYDRRKQKQYIDAFINLQDKKLKGGKKKDDKERPVKKGIRKINKTKTSRTTKKRN